MPELPEVEFAARRLRSWIVGVPVTAAGAEPGNPLRELTPAAFTAGLTGRTVQAVRRQGKQLFLDLDDDQVLLAHLGMTGKFVREIQAGPVRRGRRAWLALADGARIDFVDPRRFGRVRLLSRAAAAAHPEVRRMGPDALEVCADPATLHARLSTTRRAVKVALMDQSLLAGVGNIYAAEGLFFAGVGPARPASSLSLAEATRIGAGVLRSMTESLGREVDAEIQYLHEAAATNPFQVYGRAGEPCTTCGATIQRVMQAQRSTFWCPRCQPD